MSFEAEKYREPWESDEHWQLRKEFLEAYGNDFDEDRLLCLAQMYSNAELLECSYPEEVMQHIREMSRNLKGCPQKRKMPVEFVKEHKSTDKTGNSLSTLEGWTQKKPNVQKSFPEISKLDDDKKFQTGKTLSTDYNFQGSTDSNASCNPHTLPMQCDTQDGERIVASDTKGMDIISLAGSLSVEDVNFLTEIGKPLHVQLNNNSFGIVGYLNTFLRKFSCVPTFEISQEQNSSPISFKCDFYIKEFLIGSAVASSKKKARFESVKTGIENINNLPDVIKKINQHLFPKYANNAIPAICQFTDESTNFNMDCNDQKLNSSAQFESFMEISKAKLLERYFPNRFVILLYTEQETHHPVKVLHDSSAFSHVAISYSFEDELLQEGKQTLVKATVMLDGEICGIGISPAKLESKFAAAASALEFLKTFVYTIKVNEECEGFIITRNQLIDTSGSSNAVSDDSIGCKMLKMMGWTGGSIGKIGSSGIIEPVTSDKSHRFREGLGFSQSMQNGNDFYSRAEALIQDYAKSGTSSDLIFSSEFTKDERKVIHRIAIKYNLKNASKGGKGENRHVVLSHRFTAEELLKHLIDVGGSTFKYALTEPSSFS